MTPRPWPLRHAVCQAALLLDLVLRQRGRGLAEHHLARVVLKVGLPVATNMPEAQPAQPALHNYVQLCAATEARRRRIAVVGYMHASCKPAAAGHMQNAVKVSAGDAQL